MKTNNPFIPSNKHNPKYFCDRENETRDLIKEISKSRNVLIVSDRGVGKSRLIKHLFFILSQSGDYNPIYYNLQITPTFNSFIAEFIIGVIGVTSGKGSKKLLEFISLDISELESLKVLDQGKILKIFTKTIDFLESQDNKAVIAIDNYQFCTQLGLENFEKSFLRPLVLSNKIRIILSGTSKILLPENCRQIFLNNIEENIYKKFISNIFKKSGFSISQKSLYKIFNWSKGNTDAVQKICAGLWRKKGSKIKLRDVDAVIDELMEELNNYYVQIKKLISPYQWKLLTAIAFQVGPFQVTSSAFIERYQLNAPSSVKTALAALIDKDLIFRDRNSYLLKNVLLNNWLIHKK